MATTKSPTSKKSEATKTVKFEFFAPDAKSVCVAGTFNNWKAGATKLERDKSGKWITALNLAPGAYEYRFVVDGNWQSDQKPVECVPNPFGSYNCVVKL